jgi:D-mannonate dehydratase
MLNEEELQTKEYMEFVRVGHERQGDTDIVNTMHAYVESEIRTTRNTVRKSVNRNE